MNKPISYSQSTNQWRNSILDYNNQLPDEKQMWIDAIKRDFYTNLDYYPITKNLNITSKYDCLIYEGSEKDKLLGNKKFLSYPYDTPQFMVGDYINFQYGNSDETWIITSLDRSQIWNVNGDVERCVAELKWYDENGKLQSYPCAIKDLTTRTMPDFNSLIITQKGYVTAKIQLNSDTNIIKQNWRFLLGIPNNYTAFKVDFINNFSKTNLLVVDLEAIALAPEDDIVNGIAKNNYLPTPFPTPTGISYLLNSTNDNTVVTVDTSNNKLWYSSVKQGSENIGIFNIFAYKDNVKQSDTFTITIDSTCGVPSNYYIFTVIDGNTFKIQNNKMYLDNKLKILCTDSITGEVVELDVLLGGAFN